MEPTSTFVHALDTRFDGLGDRGASAFEIAQIMGWSDIRMAMRYTHVTSDGMRRAMQLLTHCKVGDELRRQFGSCQLDRHKIPTVEGNERWL